MAETCSCVKCKRTMASSNFYTYRDKQKCEMCKNCLTMHINNWDPETYLWILEKFDVPYIPGEWNIIRDSAYAKNPAKITGMSVIGKYFSKMKLVQWKNKRWIDTETIAAEQAELAETKAKQAEMAEDAQSKIKESFENGEISEAQYKTYLATNRPEPHFEQIGGAVTSSMTPLVGVVSTAPGFENALEYEDIELIDVGADLTQEDKVYLAMKWGRLYIAADWVALEKLYMDFKNSFDIQDAATDKTLMFICKTALKMDQCLDSGDFDTYQKLSRVYDAQMKAGKFTAAQNKDEKAKEFDAIGELVAYCEKEGGAIPKYVVDTPLDVIDKVISDLKGYTKSLITADAGLAQQIEQYIKKREIEAEQKRARELAKAQGRDYIEVTAKDTLEYSENISDQKEEDKAIYYDTESIFGEEG